jgi:hypothetical protein
MQIINPATEELVGEIRRTIGNLLPQNSIIEECTAGMVTTE